MQSLALSKQHPKPKRRQVTPSVASKSDHYTFLRGEFAVNLLECTKAIKSMFNPETFKPDEFGVSGDPSKEINRIGYATNLTPETITLAEKQRVELIITHHDVWDFMYEMKEYCAAELKRAGIAHIYSHLPLDAVDFGTAAAFANVLDSKVVKRFGRYEGFKGCVVSEFDEPIEFGDLVKKVEKVCEEKVRFWQNNDRTIRRVGICPGACVYTSYVKECIENNCDTMVAGEMLMYSIQYSAFARINLISGSHTFTEIFGVEELVKRLLTENNSIQAVRLNESHIESCS